MDEGSTVRHHRRAASRGSRADRLTVVGIDWGRGSGEHAAEMAEIPHGNLAGNMLKTLVTGGVADDCTIILAPSVKAAKFIPDGACYMVFIDGDHSHAGVTADIRAFLPKIMPNGLIAGHDYFSFPGVRSAVHAAFGYQDHMCRDAPSCWEVRL